MQFTWNVNRKNDDGLLLIEVNISASLRRKTFVTCYDKILCWGITMMVGLDYYTTVPSSFELHQRRNKPLFCLFESTIIFAHLNKEHRHMYIWTKLLNNNGGDQYSFLWWIIYLSTMVRLFVLHDNATGSIFIF